MSHLTAVAGAVFLAAIAVLAGPMTAQTIVINEFMASNDSALADEDGDHEDWIELYNAGTEPANLAGWGLSDSIAQPFRWVLPAVSIEPNGFLTVFASGKNRATYYPGTTPDWFSPPCTIAGQWMFDEEGGTVVFDASGRGNHGTLYGPTRVIDGTVGPALHLNCLQSQYVMIPSSFSLQTTRSLTISMWVKPASFWGRQNLWHKAYGGEGSLTLETNGTINYYWGTSGRDSSPYQRFNSSAAIPLNVWTHVTLVRDLEAMQLRWYFDGVQVASAPAQFSTATASISPILLGSGHVGAFDGWIAQPMIHGSFHYRLHTNFRISADGERLQLTSPDGSLTDGVGPVAVPRNLSYGRQPDGGEDWLFYNQPTPDAPNTTSGVDEWLNKPSFSHAGGWYTDAVPLSIGSEHPSAVVLYTLDGSEPLMANLDENGPEYLVNYFYPTQWETSQNIPRRNRTYLYTGPISIEARTDEENDLSEVITTYYQAPTSYRWRPPLGKVFRGTTVRARLYHEGKPSPVATQTYFIHPDGHHRYTLPVLSLTTSPNNIIGYTDGVFVEGQGYFDNGGTSSYYPGNYGNYWQEGEAWERPVNMEIFDANGSLITEHSMGMRIHGGGSRRDSLKSFRLYTRNTWLEDDAVNQPLIPGAVTYSSGEPLETFKRLLIRAGGNIRNHLRDVTAHRIMEGAYDGIQRSRPVVHFFNGEYWGIMYIRERQDRYHIANNYGLDPDNVIILEAPWGQGTTSQVEEGFPQDILLYRDMYNFVVNNDMSDPAHYAHLTTLLDVQSYIDYNVMFIYFVNVDWYGWKHFRYWRARETSDAPYADGRWRMMVWDFDEAGMTSRAASDFLASFIHPLGGGDVFPTGNPARTALLRNLLENPEFKNLFINRFADHINSTFHSQHVQQVVTQEFAKVAAELPEHFIRWNANATSQATVDAFVTFSQQRPYHQRQHLMTHFGLAGETNVTLDVNESGRGHIAINTITIHPNTPGVPDDPYPWTGVYFKSVPITITAIPEPGYRFAHWDGPDGIDSESETLTLSLTENVALTAHFEEVPVPTPLHYWHFNALPGGTLATVAADYSIGGTASISYPGSGAGYMDSVSEGTALNAQMGEAAGSGLRVRNPSNTRELLLSLPTAGYQDMTLSYAATRTTNGAQTQSIYYRLGNQEPWVLQQAGVSITEQYQLFSFDFSGVAGAEDNAEFAVRILFGGSNASGTSGNNRFDNIVLEGIPMAGTNQPPQLVEPIPLTAVIAGTPTTIDLASYWVDPDDDVLTFTADADRPSVVVPSVSGSTLTLTPAYQGDAYVTVTADDGHNAPVVATFRVLAYPQAHQLNAGGFAFTAWDPGTPEHVYPTSMLFLQTDVPDPKVGAELAFPYFIPHNDYHEDDGSTIGFPYNNTRRTRLNGLGPDGISFINTGRARDLGGALLAVNTQGCTSVAVRWTAGTVLMNERSYGLRLQYRLGTAGPFSDVLVSGQPVEYVAGPDSEGQPMGKAMLPGEALNQPYVQILWRYHHLTGDSGARAELRLDDLLVAAPVVPADFDVDGDVDGDDLAILQACVSGAAVPYEPANLPPGCALVPDEDGIIAADFDRDSDVDQSDFGLFQRCLSGHGRPADPLCATP